MAALIRPTIASYDVHESFVVDTQDHEDHTFCGVMFDCQCRPNPSGPIDYIEVQSVAVRGKLQSNLAHRFALWSTANRRASSEHCVALLSTRTSTRMGPR